jgi:hypothetical protein
MASRKSKKVHRERDRLPRRMFKRESGPEIPPDSESGSHPQFLSRFKRRLGPALPPGSEIVIEPAGREKMSKVLEDFIEPYKESAGTVEDMRKLLSLGVLAWNAALFPEEERPAIIDELLRVGFSRGTEPDRVQVREFVEALVRRKEEHFAAHRREIVSFDLTQTASGYQLLVMSGL